MKTGKPVSVSNLSLGNTQKNTKKEIKYLVFCICRSKIDGNQNYLQKYFTLKFLYFNREK